MVRAVALPASALVLLLLGGGCRKIQFQWDEPKQDPFAVQIRVDSDPDVPLAGAQLLLAGAPLATTDKAGTAAVFLDGKEGDQVEVTVRCPSEFESPASPLVIGLRRFASGSPIPHFEARCRPTLRTVVVGLRVENGPNLPVQYLGRTVARTDGSGAALFTIHTKPDDQVDVTLDTDDSPEPLRPENPKLTFVTKDQDDFVVLEQTFSVEKKVVKARPAAAPAPARPTPLP